MEGVINICKVLDLGSLSTLTNKEISKINRYSDKYVNTRMSTRPDQDLVFH
jgi:hypothetical protein